MSLHPIQSRISILFISVLLAATQASAQLLPRDAYVQSAAVDAAGNIYLTGYIQTPKLPTTPGVFQPNPVIDCSNDPFCDYGFAAKVAPSGDKLEWATYLGAGGMNYPTVVAVAADDTIYVAGSTYSKSFLPPVGGYQSAPAGLFVARLSADNSSVLSATYFGGPGTKYTLNGSQADTIAAMKLDSAGNVYIAGNANSIPFPTTPGAYQRERSSVQRDLCSEGPDQFVAKFDPALKSLIFSTLIGTAGRNAASDLVLGPDGSIYLAGTHGIERACPTDGVVTRLSPDARTLIYSTSLGTSPRGAYALAVDSRGNAFAGSDTRLWMPPETGSITEIDAQGTIAKTRNIEGSARSIAAGPNGEVVVAGFASPDRLSPTADGPGPCSRGSYYTEKSYVARLRAPALDVSYVGFMSSGLLWLLGTDRVLVSNPYSTLAPFAILPAGPPPAGTVTCLASAATYSSDVIAPGELVAMFGNQIGPAAPLGMELDDHGNVTKNLGGFSVFVDGLAAPMLYAGPSQINFVVPFGIRDARQVHVELRRDSTRTLPAAVLAAFDKSQLPVWVGLFGGSASGVAALAAINQDGTPNSASNPAPLGSVISIYGTGFGAMAPPAIDGARSSLPESTPVAKVSVKVNGQPAQMEYIGNAPTLVQGVVQINVRLPQTLAALPGLEPNTAMILADAGTVTNGNSSWTSASYGVVYVR